MKYIHYFKTSSQYTSAKESLNPSEPWVSYIEQYSTLTYSPAVNISGYDYVDLGLPSGTLWATCNLGAGSDPFNYGGYYAWGETSTKTGYTSNNYAFAGGSKYNATDGKTRLGLEDDAVHMSMGGDWHIPTSDNFYELISYTNVEPYTHENDVSGVIFTSTVNQNSIFIPFSGRRVDYTTYVLGSVAALWSCDIGNTDNLASQLLISTDSLTPTINSNQTRYWGCSVRGVVSRRWYNPLLL